MTKRRKDAKRTKVPAVVEAIPEPAEIAAPVVEPEAPIAPPADEPRGLECPKCACRHFNVVYTIPKRSCIVRRKECRHCGHRILTREQLQGFHG